MPAPNVRERDLVKCEDMRQHAERARQHLGLLTFEEFFANPLVRDAVVRCVEVIGEAARLVSEETRKQSPEIPWPLIVGMRHILAHEYGEVHLDKIYEVVNHHLPTLLVRLHVLIESLERDVGWTGNEPPG